MSELRALLRPDRLRSVERPFGWLPCRMLTNGTIASMSPMERQLYLVLALAADRQGVSFYSDKRLQCILGTTCAELAEARAGLVARDLLAFDAPAYQLLAQPPDPERTAREPHVRTRPRPRAAPPRAQAVPVGSPVEARQRTAMPEDVRQSLRKLFGPESF